MQLRDTRLLLVILGIPNSSNLQQQRWAGASVQTTQHKDLKQARM